MSIKADRVGYQGESGAYSEKAILQLYGEKQVQQVPYRTFYDVVDALEKNEIEYALLPIDNTIIGNITHTYDLLLENKLTILKETILPINHSLLIHKDGKKENIKKIFSHPAAIAQCEVFLRMYSNVEIVPTYDTAGSAKMISEKGLKDTAAIASLESAEKYGLKGLVAKSR